MLPDHPHDFTLGFDVHLLRDRDHGLFGLTSSLGLEIITITHIGVTFRGVRHVQLHLEPPEKQKIKTENEFAPRF